MKNLFYALLCMGIFIPSISSGQTMVFEDFTNNPGGRWKFITDQVMGGVSTGNLEFRNEANKKFARMTGMVSLENKGGFIQFRRKVIGQFDKNLSGLLVSLRGDGEVYYIHLRTSGTFLPWQYYQASFKSEKKWKTVKIPFSEFRKSGWILSDNINPKNINSIGIVAFGKKQFVNIDVKKISLY